MTPWGCLTSYRDEKKSLRTIQDQQFEFAYSILKDKFGISVFIYEDLFEEKNKDSLPNLELFLGKCSPDALLGLEISCGLLKSFGLSILMLEDFIPVEKALELSRLEDRFQYDLFGKVEEFHVFDETELFMKLMGLKIFWKTNKGSN